jgi:multidrug efflux pump subunit AcrA (membrane-fusion protein)
MSDVERIFDRFIDAFADDLLEIARAYIGVEMDRALAVAQRSSSKQTKAQLRAQKKAQRLAAKAQLKVEQQRKREAKRNARLAEKERIKAERIAEKELRQVEHDRLKQQRMALKQELEAERRRLREATRKRPVRQLPLDFDGLRTPKPRRGAPAANSPPQLFVHKRKRDGQIEKLARNDGAPVPNGAPVTSGASVTNGAAATPPEAPAAPAE